MKWVCDISASFFCSPFGDFFAALLPVLSGVLMYLTTHGRESQGT